MRIAVLSGKGGTEKTLVSVNLASAAKKSIYIDCDVEEPSGHLFFKPKGLKEVEIVIKIPSVDEQFCTGCRTCVALCKFNALAYINGKLKIFDEVCHSCGGCVLLSPVKALEEKDKVIGKVQKGISNDVTVITGMLNTGEASGVPIVKKLLSENKLLEETLTFVDCPPGSACIVMESIKDVDYCILVAEPTLFGVHNLQMVYELVRLFKKPHGVILNKCLDGENPAESFCIKKGLKILGRIPFDSILGTLNSNAAIAVRVNESYQTMFTSLLEKVIGVVSGKGGVGKSLVTAMLAVTMRRMGYHTAILDADVTGPSIPKVFGIKGKATGNEFGLFPSKSKTGIDVMSINLLLENDTDPVI